MVNLTDRELALFEKSSKGNPNKRHALEIYALVKQNKVKRALDIGTGDWFMALSMALGGAWVVTLDTKKTTPAWFGILNSYQDKVFQVIESPRQYLSNRKNLWDLIFVNLDNYPNFSDEVLENLIRVQGKYLITFSKAEGLQINEKA